MSKSTFGAWESQGEEVDAALWRVASVHQVFATDAGGMVCMCGARPVTHRAATEHILDEAVKALPARAKVASDIYARCARAPRGWWCSRPPQHDGPCAARPRWWNFRRLTRRHSTSLTVSEDQ